MGTLREARATGTAGSIFIAFGIAFLGVAFLFGLVSIVIGLVLILLAVEKISNVTDNRDPYVNLVVAAACLIIAVLAGIVFVIQGSISAIGIGSPTTVTSEGYPLSLVNFLTSTLVGFVAICFLVIVAALFWKRSYDSI